MKLTRIGTIQDTESGTDYYLLDNLTDTDDDIAPDLSTLMPNGELSALTPIEMKSLTDVLEDYLDTEHNLAARGCGCSHDCCGHRVHNHPQLIPDTLHDSFIIAHSWGINC